MSVRTNIVVSVDEINGGNLEVIRVATTSFPNTIVLTIGDSGAKAAVHIDDLQKSIDEAREFLKTRPAQPKTPQAGGLTPDTIKIEDASSELSEN